MPGRGRAVQTRALLPKRAGLAFQAGNSRINDTSPILSQRHTAEGVVYM